MPRPERASRLAYCRELQVHSDACVEVVDAAFGALREKLLREDPPDAPARLARLNAAHKALREGDARGGVF